MRDIAMKRLSKSFRPTIPLQVLGEFLGFSSEEEPELTKFILDKGATLIKQSTTGTNKKEKQEIHVDLKPAYDALLERRW